MKDKIPKDIPATVDRMYHNYLYRVGLNPITLYKRNTFMKKTDFELFRKCNNYIKNFESPIKKRIIDYVAGNDGVSQLEIFETLKEHQSIVSKNAKTLVRIGVLSVEKSRTDKRNNCYYLEDVGYEKLKTLHETPGLVTVLRHLTSPVKQKLLLFLDEHNPESVSQCAKQLGISKPYATTLLTTMLDDGIVCRETYGRHASYRVNHKYIAGIIKTVNQYKHLYK